MPRATSEKQYNTFIKGIITEANPLTFPENASLDEDNFNLRRNGSRERRLGVDYETGYTLTSTGFASEIISSGRQSFHTWKNPGGDTTVSIGVIRVYNKLWFIDLFSTTPSSSFLNSGNPVTITGLTNSEIETALVNNFLIVVSKELDNPIALSYDRDTDTVSSTDVPLQVRDFWGIVDGLVVDERPTTLTTKHLYNLINQGWNSKIKSVCDETDETSRLFKLISTSFTSISDTLISEPEVVTNTYEIPRAVACMYTKTETYPSNSDVWTIGKGADATKTNQFEKFVPWRLTTNNVYSMEAPKGAFVISPYNRGVVRRRLLGSTDLPADTEHGRVSTIAAYAGRVFYSGIESYITDGDGNSPNLSNYIFFSQVVTSGDMIGKCYQDADPTSDRISDIVDTDGGTIQIPEAAKIVKLIPAKSSLLVFAENGVWEVFGDTQGFVATSYQVNKLSSNGCSSPKSIVEASGNVLAWTKAGIYLYSEDQVSGRYKAENISLNTIQTLYNDISELGKSNCRSFYDEKENQIRWLYNDTSTYSNSTYVNNYNRELIFDATLMAFFPHSISSSVPYVADYVDIPSYTVTDIEESVYAENEPVLDSTLAQVIIPSHISAARVSQFAFLTIVGTSFTLSKYQDTSFVDWYTYDATGVDYQSYLLTGYEIFGEFLRNKQVPYTWFYFQRTEDGFSEVGTDLILDHQSSCLVSSQWNWTDSAASGKWGSSFQAYRLTRPYIPSGPADTFDYGYEVIVTKNKIRGKGRALSLLLESETGKDLRLLGWAHIVTGDARP
jgi:hypothetical protein